VIGNQLLDEPNDAASNERGQFSLRVPDGEVWLDACARGYEFSRVTLAPTDTVAVFHGRRSVERSLPDTVRLSGADIENIEIIRGTAAAALHGAPAAGGIIQITTKNGVAARWPLERDRVEPVLVIDGVVVNAAKQISPPCGMTPYLGYHIQFRIF
jgi:TonB-dependent SusC/RagA subfamily outer membrane receptor